LANQALVTGRPDQKTDLQRTVLCVEDSIVGYSEPKFIVIRFCSQGRKHHRRAPLAALCAAEPAVFPCGSVRCI